MNFLLDTSVFLWAMGAPERLNRRARDLLSDDRGGLFLSAASSWEISLKYGLGKLELPSPPPKYVPERMLSWGISGLDISHLHALAVGGLPQHHQDPFDRMLIAQAAAEGMILMTTDRMFERYSVEVIWCGV